MLLVLVGLWLILGGQAPVLPFCGWREHSREDPVLSHWRDDRRLELFKSTSVPLLTGSTIRQFSSSAALLAFEVLVVVVVVVVVGRTVGSISSKTLAYECLCTLELCTASMIATI